MVPLSLPAFFRCSLFAACLALAPWIAAQDALLNDFSQRPEIENRLATVRSEISALPADADAALRERLQQLEALCQFHLTATDIAAKVRGERDHAAQAATAWRGFPQPPPHSILLLDDIRETLATLADTQRAGDAQVRIFTAEIEAARDKLQGYQEAERRFMEAAATAATAATPEARLSAERSVKLERVSSRIAAEEIARITLRLAAQQAELGMIHSKSELAGRQLKAIEGKTAFPQSDLDAIHQRIAAQRAEALNALLGTSQHQQAPHPLLAWSIEFLDLEKKFWDTRFGALTTKDAATRKAALAALAEFKARCDDWTEIAQLRLAGGTIGGTEIDPARLRDGLLRASQMQRRIGFAIDDIKGGKRGTPVLDRVSSAMVSLWNMELYLAEETDIIEGKKVPIYRAVTLGKLVRLACILTVGWLILRFLLRRMNNLISRSSKLPEIAAGIISKAGFILGLALLLLYGMNTVHIPLTVFAFLGGALAIGIGFGTQTLLKNFISGIIIIFERPFKVGDSVEIEGITGIIRSIGIRASIIRHGNGIDTLIPNSTLLENKVTNWNLTDSLLRHSITVGVDYGSPAREVSRALRAVADDHGLVLEHPEPEVRFEDFGDKALVFRLLFWFDASRTNRDTLASDLRFMIEKTFAEAGIVIAFPQRDIQFDPNTPLRVELSRKTTTASNKETES